MEFSFALHRNVLRSLFEVTNTLLWRGVSVYKVARVGVKGGNLIFQRSDGFVDVNLVLAHSAGCGEGEILVRADLFSELLRYLPVEMVELRVKDETLTLSCGGFVGVYNVGKVEEQTMRSWKSEYDLVSFNTVPAASLSRAINSLTHIVSKTIPFGPLRGILFEKGVAIATDMIRYHWVETGVDKSICFYLPYDLMALPALLAVLGVEEIKIGYLVNNEEGELILKLGDSWIVAGPLRFKEEFSDVKASLSMYWMRIDGGTAFQPLATFEFETALLRDIVQRVSVTSNKTTREINYKVNQTEGLVFKSQDPFGNSSQEAVPALDGRIGASVEGTVNWYFLLQALDALKTSTVTMVIGKNILKLIPQNRAEEFYLATIVS